MRGGGGADHGTSSTVPQIGSSSGSVDLIELQRRLMRGEATDEELMLALAQDSAKAVYNPRLLLCVCNYDTGSVC